MGNRRDASKKKDAVLYVRCAADLLHELDQLVVSERKRTGYPLSRADIVRKLLGERLGLHRGDPK